VLSLASTADASAAEEASNVAIRARHAACRLPPHLRGKPGDLKRDLGGWGCGIFLCCAGGDRNGQCGRVSGQKVSGDASLARGVPSSARSSPCNVCAKVGGSGGFSRLPQIVASGGSCALLLVTQPRWTCAALCTSRERQERNNCAWMSGMCSLCA